MGRGTTSGAVTAAGALVDKPSTFRDSILPSTKWGCIHSFDKYILSTYGKEQKSSLPSWNSGDGDRQKATEEET